MPSFYNINLFRSFSLTYTHTQIGNSCVSLANGLKNATESSQYCSSKKLRFGLALCCELHQCVMTSTAQGGGVPFRRGEQIAPIHQHVVQYMCELFLLLRSTGHHGCHWEYVAYCKVFSRCQ